MSEHEFRISPISLLFEARHELRKHLALETKLIECIDALPEDDFCHHARESLQLGAGYALLRLSHDLGFTIENTRTAIDPESLRNAHATYFSIQPRNKYEPEDEAQERHKHLSDASLVRTYNRPRLDIEARVDPYELNALTAFTDGYIIVIDELNVIDRSHPSATELA